MEIKPSLFSKRVYYYLLGMKNKCTTRKLLGLGILNSAFEMLILEAQLGNELALVCIVPLFEPLVKDP